MPELNPNWCKDFECKDCYRYNQCWACKKADLENMRTCGRSAKEKNNDCFECNINEVSNDDSTGSN